MNTYSFKNRELSWLDFNERVLQEAEDISVPLIERLRFIGIFSNNLDEFYKIRYATVKRIALSNQKAKKLYKGESAKDLLNKITLRAINLQEKSTIIFNSILEDLKKENIHIINEKNKIYFFNNLWIKYPDEYMASFELLSKKSDSINSLGDSYKIVVEKSIIKIKDNALICPQAMLRMLMRRTM